MSQILSPEIFEWVLLLTRWLHITVAVTWIGTSIFFMWLDRSFEVPSEERPSLHVPPRIGSAAAAGTGELWMVHGGGFYQVKKLQMGTTKVPNHLHWFRWESYWTWMSGMALLLLMFYTGEGALLLDATVSSINYYEAAGIGLLAVFVSWFFYDLLWESKIVQAVPFVGHAFTLLWFVFAAYALCQTLSGRAAYMHLGAMIGTWMSGNVFLRIIPRQIKMVDAARKGEPVNEAWAKNAKNRSTHNTYFTLPIIFIMISNHFPTTYGHSLSWLVAVFVTAAGASIRHAFVVRVKEPGKANGFIALGVLLLIAVIVLTKETL